MIKQADDNHISILNNDTICIFPLSPCTRFSLQYYQL
uniref:Uncharacterized protein n=1 Tax=Lepeophtheirus salmonis TaxID=72036 RepID=A0A0K2T3Y5_LEPSM